MGLIAGFARHPNAANLLMVLMLGLGIYALAGLTTRFWPPANLSEVEVSISWPGASAEDVSQNILDGGRAGGALPHRSGQPALHRPRGLGLHLGRVRGRHRHAEGLLRRGAGHRRARHPARRRRAPGRAVRHAARLGRPRSPSLAPSRRRRCRRSPAASATICWRAIWRRSPSAARVSARSSSTRASTTFCALG